MGRVNGMHLWNVGCDRVEIISYKCICQIYVIIVVLVYELNLIVRVFEVCGSVFY